MADSKDSMGMVWDAQAYRKAASYVPKLTTKILQWLDARPGESILDIGCGDGPLTLQIAKSLQPGGRIHGIDSSSAMLAQACAETDQGLSNATFELLDANFLSAKPEHQIASYDKVFSNAALHWVLASSPDPGQFFRGVNKALKPGGIFVFEMGGMGNVREMRTAFLATVSKRVGIEKAREADPWFFPDDTWMKRILEENGFVIEKIELEERPTPATATESDSGILGWTRLMGKPFFDAIRDEDERERCIMEAIDILKTVSTAPDGKEIIGYVRLRVLARKSEQL